MKKIKNTIKILSILFLLTNGFSVIISGCTGFTKSINNKVLVGLNEDNYSSRRYLEIHPPEEGRYGKLYCIYSGWGIQQIINDHGLLWDGFWAPHLDINEGEGKPKPDSWIDEWMNTCSTVDDIIDMYNKYDWRDTAMEDAMLFFVDKQGSSVIIEGDEIIKKEADFQVVTNFYQSHPELGGYGFDRYDIVVNMLKNIDDISMNYFKDICDATHNTYTIYSLVCNLSSNILHYYYNGNFNNVWIINLTEEFDFGTHSYDVLDVFNNHPPNKPTVPIGPNVGFVNTTYNFSCKTFDIEGDQLYYKWFWGDGSYSKWIGPYDSNELCEIDHCWFNKGEYSVRVMARDNLCGKSELSDPLVVSMPKNKAINLNLFLQRFFQRFPLFEKILNQIIQVV